MDADPENWVNNVDANGSYWVSPEILERERNPDNHFWAVARFADRKQSIGVILPWWIYRTIANSAAGPAGTRYVNSLILIVIWF